MMPTRVDIAIVGGGPVGLSLAAMLVAQGIDPNKIALLDAKPLALAAADPRSIALSYGSRELLSKIAAWPTVATPITQIHVSRRGSFGRTLIESEDYKLPALGYVCRYGDLVHALDAVMAAGLHACRPATVVSLQPRDDHAVLTLSDGSEVSTSVVVHSEGGVFSEQNAKTQYRDYAQVAITSTVHATAPSGGRAYERFTSEGPLALLPQTDGYAMVWCVSPITSEWLLALDDDGFLAELQRVFGQRVGTFTRIGPRHHYPLGLNAAPHTTARTVAIGNAAQTLHPVAGQGLNLGLRDAAVLSRMLVRDLSADTLTAFERQRQGDRSTTVRITDLMARVFANDSDGSVSQRLLGLSLGALDFVPPAKRLLAEQMMYGWR
jgi:2-octaprenyl-6-methoxyphenol hydroxylase